MTSMTELGESAMDTLRTTAAKSSQIVNPVMAALHDAHLPP
jgi:hypothetical protein